VEENFYQKELISLINHESAMDEEIVETEIHEYGSNVIIGMQKGQKIKWTESITTSRIHILEEYEPTGTQKLKTEDVVGELNKVPENIRKYINIIVLTPFIHPCIDYFIKRSGRELIAFASSDYLKREITIFPTPVERSEAKQTLSQQLTLAHEAGHIIDAVIQPPEMGFFAYTPTWTKAICRDTNVEKMRRNLPSYLVSPYAEEMKSLREDFADSVMYFSDEENYKKCLKENFPHRYKILENILGDNEPL